MNEEDFYDMGTYLEERRSTDDRPAHNGLEGCLLGILIGGLIFLFKLLTGL